MSRRICMMVSVGLVPLMAGCTGRLFPRPTSVTVNLVNHSDFAVEVDLYISNEQDVPESILVTLGEKIEFTVPAGETRTFTRDCDDLQAIIISDADLMVIGQIGPSADTDVLRDGTQFNCGDTIDFTFDHSPAIVDFAITTSVHS